MIVTESSCLPCDTWNMGGLGSSSGFLLHTVRNQTCSTYVLDLEPSAIHLVGGEGGATITTAREQEHF